MWALLSEDAIQEGGNNYVKDPLSDYKETSDPYTLNYHQGMKADYRK